jgi:hypothetical protein
VTVLTDTNGVLKEPTNFFAANSNLLSQSVAGGGGGGGSQTPWTATENGAGYSLTGVNNLMVTNSVSITNAQGTNFLSSSNITIASASSLSTLTFAEPAFGAQPISLVASAAGLAIGGLVLDDNGDITWVNNLHSYGTITGTNFAGNGSGLTNLNAAALGGGSLPSGVVSIVNTNASGVLVTNPGSAFSWSVLSNGLVKWVGSLPSLSMAPGSSLSIGMFTNLPYGGLSNWGFGTMNIFWDTHGKSESAVALQDYQGDILYYGDNANMVTMPLGARNSMLGLYDATDQFWPLRWTPDGYLTLDGSGTGGGVIQVYGPATITGFALSSNTYAGNGAGLTSLSAGNVSGSFLSPLVVSNTSFPMIVMNGGVTYPPVHHSDFQANFGGVNYWDEQYSTNTTELLDLNGNVVWASTNTTDGTWFAYLSGNGAGLTNLNASALASGTVGLAQLPATSGNIGNTVVSRDGSGSFSAGTVTATTFSGSGGSLTGLNANNLGNGTVPLARLSSAVLTNAFAGTVSATAFSGDGSGLTGVTAGLPAYALTNYDANNRNFNGALSIGGSLTLSNTLICPLINNQIRDAVIGPTGVTNEYTQWQFVSTTNSTATFNIGTNTFLNGQNGVVWHSLDVAAYSGVTTNWYYVASGIQEGYTNTTSGSTVPTGFFMTGGTVKTSASGASIAVGNTAAGGIIYSIVTPGAAAASNTINWAFKWQWHQAK